MITDVFIDVLINLWLLIAGIFLSFELANASLSVVRKFSAPRRFLPSPVVALLPAPAPARHIISAHYVALVVAGRAAQLAIGLPDAHKCHCLSVEAA